ncbi:hypothetical protein V6Z11_D09G091500 [Gossypium hirsutum]
MKSIIHCLKRKKKVLPFWAGCGRGGIQIPTPWFVAMCSTPLSYRPHLVSIEFVPRNTLKEVTFPLPNHFELRRCESASLSIRTMHSEV